MARMGTLGRGRRPMARPLRQDVGESGGQVDGSGVHGGRRTGPGPADHSGPVLWTCAGVGESGGRTFDKGLRWPTYWPGTACHMWGPVLWTHPRTK